MPNTSSLSSLVAQTLREALSLSAPFYCYIFIFCSLAACSRWSNDDETFVRTYTEIIIVREQYPDTALANTKVAAILRQNGFTEVSFRERFRELAKTPEHLRQILDTARNRARRIGEEEQKAEQKLEQKKEQNKERKSEQKNERQQQLQ